MGLGLLESRVRGFSTYIIISIIIIIFLRSEKVHYSFESSKLYVAALLLATSASDRTLTLFSPPFGLSQTFIKVPMLLGA